ncbi:hypothetical protein NGRA_1743 [Nosema granulosis]|uniref:Uncharacterized protein n=1 Tax=Nosema granulosis TaxID=83296 RepID=A0A9P6GYX2_9MICR|nr:hypothetical protein NGRA_1743 [Nosema granulosis]
MENKIPNDTFALLFASASKNVDNLEQLGRNIGRRLCEDFLLRTKATAKIVPMKVPENISLFFTIYFSYTPKVESNIVYFEDFYGLKYADGNSLKMFKGVFEEIYSHLCEGKVEIEVDESTKILIVK